MDYAALIGADVSKLLPQDFNPVAKAVIERMPSGEFEAQLAISNEDKPETFEQLTKAILNYCKTDEERQAVINQLLILFSKKLSKVENDPKLSAETKKAFRDAAERVKNLNQSFWTRPVLGPVPGWGVAAGGAGILGVLAMLMFRRR